MAPRARLELATLRLTAITLYSYGEPFGRVSWTETKDLASPECPERAFEVWSNVQWMFSGNGKSPHPSLKGVDLRVWTADLRDILWRTLSPAAPQFSRGLDRDFLPGIFNNLVGLGYSGSGTVSSRYPRDIELNFGRHLGITSFTLFDRQRSR